MSKGEGYLILKRIVDASASFLGLLLLLPSFIFLLLVIKLSSPGPVFFKQERMGLRGKPFHILKFRTMVVNAEKVGTQITVGEDRRITKIGAFLRKLKLDELPQLINVFLGEMSLVGPRPEVRKYVELYPEEYKRVLSVRPGITDYASLKFSNENEILGQSTNPEETYVKEVLPEKLKLNQAYIEEMSLRTDLDLIWSTVSKVFIKGNEN